MRTSPPQRSFSSGEVSELLARRSDYARTQQGLARCRGFLPLRQGGFTRAPGTWYRGQTRGNARALIIEFEFAQDDACVLELTSGWLRVWRYGQLVTAGGAPYELAIPYVEADFDRLQWVQSADVIYFVDGQRPMHRLARAALSDWTIEEVSPSTGPFRAQNLDPARTLRASGETGTVTLTANGSFFRSNHVGMLMQLSPTDNRQVPLWEAEEAVTVGEYRRYNGRTYELTHNDREDDKVGSTPPTHEEGEVMVVGRGEVRWRFVSTSTGTVRILSVSSTTSATARVIRAIPRGCIDDPTYRWSEGAWNARYGYPSAIEIFEQRLVAAGTPSEPRTLWFSSVGDFLDFAPGTEADDAFAYAIAGQASQNRIVWLRTGRAGLHIGALGEEYSSRSTDQATVIGPTNARFGLDSAIGSARVRPIAIDGDVLFVGKGGARAMLISYSFQADANRAQELSLPAHHLGTGFAELAWQGAPQRLAWLRRQDGQLAVMVYDPDEEVLGWALHTLAGGVIESMAVTSDAAGESDTLTLAVRRTVGGETVRYIEELALLWGVLPDERPLREACYLMSAVRVAPAEATAQFSAPHLAGAEVHVWTEAGHIGPVTVTEDGILSLPDPVGQAIIGLHDATHVAETLDIVAAAPDGATLGRRKRLHSRTGIAVHRTAGGFACTVARSLSQADRVGARRRLIDRPAAQGAVDARTGVAQLPLPSGHAEELAIRFEPEPGAPMTVLALVPMVEEAGA